MAIKLQEQLRIDYPDDERLRHAGIRLGILRLDELHPRVSGNKWFKLEENLNAAREAGAMRLLTFGGAYSNHLLATAAAAHHLGWESIGMVRGLHAREALTGTLQECAALGMELVFLSREEYNEKESPRFLDILRSRYPQTWIIPEGGNNEAGTKGAGSITRYLPADSTHIAVAIGTGTTFAGIRATLDARIAMLGFPVMKGGAYLEAILKDRIPSTQNNWSLCDAYHFGGFGRHTEALLSFMNDFYERHRIPLDFVYTGKMMCGIFEMIEAGSLPPGSHVIAIHTGGLQGNRSIARHLCYGPADS
ncbi:1-aminocyclopropane-1-carboxylate deaminase/D-cysteine desulfhydrase [Taibaiella koreensis]|uniref:1-aminocyclopropane-1-carboxylate deaminase/D-cysteine desulfhydrase n=1 Tax=Taibaiella koreensis TaxID=1268548 RepID=UPI000E59A6A5|nr:pyridoxal-phosphate dependent enzyme [Taibaiella koreensis]